MGQELALPIVREQELAAEPRKWTTLMVVCALASNYGPWEIDHAKRILAREKQDPIQLLAEAQRLLEPVGGKWLADRLRALWQSTTPTSSMTAESWLKETGRALKTYPLHILHHAIDAAFHNASRGFTPSAGEIVAIAAPLVVELRQQRDRLDAIVNPRPKVKRPWELDDDEIERCTPEDAARIKAEAGIGPAADSHPREVGPRRTPTAADYIAMGVDPAALARQSDDQEEVQ